MAGIYRALILLSGLLIAVFYWAPYYPDLDDRDFWDLMLQWDGHGALLPYIQAIYVALTIAWVLVLIGLYFYVAIARPALFVLLLVSASMALLEGIRVSHPVDGFLGSVLYPIHGAVLVMAYFTSVSTKFVNRRIADGANS